jgi:hypothetical protein
MSSTNFAEPISSCTTIAELNSIIAVASLSLKKLHELAKIEAHHKQLPHHATFRFIRNDGKRNPSQFEHQKLLRFVKVLLQLLRTSGEIELVCRVKSIVSECIQLNRSGDTSYSPLTNAVVQRLRPLDGMENYWARAHNQLLSQISVSKNWTKEWHNSFKHFQNHKTSRIKKIIHQPCDRSTYLDSPEKEAT